MERGVGRSSDPWHEEPGSGPCGARVGLLVKPQWGSELDHRRPHACMTGDTFPRSRALGIWVGLLFTESLHGIVRRLVLEPQLGDLRARQVSVLSGSVLIVLVVWLTIRWLGAHPPRRWWLLGVLWLVLTLAFEMALGRALGASWERIASDFDPRHGGFLGFGMLVIALAPRVLAARRGLIRQYDRPPSH